MWLEHVLWRTEDVLLSFSGLWCNSVIKIMTHPLTSTYAPEILLNLLRHELIHLSRCCLTFTWWRLRLFLVIVDHNLKTHVPFSTVLMWMSSWFFVAETMKVTNSMTLGISRIRSPLSDFWCSGLSRSKMNWSDCDVISSLTRASIGSRCFILQCLPSSSTRYRVVLLSISMRSRFLYPCRSNLCTGLQYCNQQHNTMLRQWKKYFRYLICGLQQKG